MYAPSQSLKPLSGISLTADEKKLLSWLKTAPWEPQAGAQTPVPYKAKVPEFYSGLRLYQVQGGGGAGAAYGMLGLFIKKLESQGVISKQDLYPVAAQGNARYLTLKKNDLENLGVGQEEEED
ncbi:MAG: hypothetical protein K2Q01_08490 [Rickettsiales bacterium]|nr:hypothetical protein [Rickettsiales bacterium]